jgi:methyl-accepting chemotaxis protein
VDKYSTKKYDAGKINKFNASLTLVFAVLLSIQAFVKGGSTYGVMVLTANFIASGIAWICYLLHKKHIVKTSIAATIISLLPVVTGITVSYFGNGGLAYKVFLVFLMSNAMAGLYFKKSIVILNGILTNIIVLAVTFIAPFTLIKEPFLIKEIIMTLVIMDCSILIMYFLTKWGNEYVQSAIEKEKQAQLLVDQLETAMQKINETAEILNSNLINSNIELSQIKESSSHITTAISEIAKGVEEEANGVTSIVNTVNQAVDSMNNLHILSKNIKETSDNVSLIVNNSSDSMNSMTDQINTIEEAVSGALETVSELEVNMESINNFLSAITQIAEQTNLLALNAAIEAARAGESGKGFAVVADEVRKLAEQSSNTAKEIYNIISTTRQKSRMALIKAQEGNAAVKIGNKIVYEINGGFQQMKAAFDTMDNSIEKEYEMIENINQLYSNIQGQLENIAAISEQHAATTQEVLAATENQNNNIIEIAKNSEELNNASKELKAVLDVK